MIELDKVTKIKIARVMPMLAENQRRKFLGIEADEELQELNISKNEFHGE